jgi:hypothetical protein
MNGKIAMYIKTQLTHMIQNDLLKVFISLHLNFSSSLTILVFATLSTLSACLSRRVKKIAQMKENTHTKNPTSRARPSLSIC